MGDWTVDRVTLIFDEFTFGRNFDVDRVFMLCAHLERHHNI